jgi:hypothetical protein
VNETTAARPSDSARSTFALNVLGIGLVLTLGVVSCLRLTRTTSAPGAERLGNFLAYCLVAALWAWFARADRQGRTWARTAGTVSFALWLLPVIGDTLGIAAMTLDGWQIATCLLAFLVGTAGLASVVTMWRRPSAAVEKALG